MRTLLVSSTLLCAALGCALEPSGEKSDELGTLELSLSATAASGTTYRLRFAQIAITGGGRTVTVSTEDGPASETELALDLPVGTYEVRLLPGWLLARTPPGGAEEMGVAATVVDDTLALSVSTSGVAQAVFRFVVDEGSVAFGDARVSIEVIEEGCAPPATDCGGACVDLATDELHCGACGRACAGGSVCTAGVCQPSCPGQTQCGGACVDLATDELHCGACGRACAGGSVCSAGSCQAPSCAPNQTQCGGLCVDLMSDELHCGACGAVCRPLLFWPRTCVMGICQL